MSEQEQTIDLRILLRVFIEHIIVIVVAGVVAAAIGFSVATFLVPKRYTSTAMMYVENTGSKQESDTLSVSDINAAQKLVNTCQILFKSPDVLKNISEQFSGAYSSGQLDKMIKIEAVNNTEVLRITVESDSGNSANEVCNAMVESSTREFKRVIKGGSIETVSLPTMPKTHTYPSATKFAIIGGAAGVLVFYLFFLIKELLDTKVKPDDDLTLMYDIPVFAEILDFEMAGRGGYKYSKYGYGKYSSYSSYDTDNNKEEKLFSKGYDDDSDEEPEEDDEPENEKKGRKNKDKDKGKDKDIEDKSEEKEVKAKDGEKKK